MAQALLWSGLPEHEFLGKCSCPGVVINEKNMIKVCRNARVSVSLLVFVLLPLAACTIKGGNPNLDDQDVRLTILHTSDIHSRLIKYRFSPGLNDRNLGLDRDLAEEYGVGGVDRLAYLLSRER